MVSAAVETSAPTFKLKTNDDSNNMRRKIDTFLGERIPKMPIVIKDWVRELIVENEEDICSVDELTEVVGDHLYNSSKDITRDSVSRLCESLFELVLTGNKEQTRREMDVARKLDATVDMSIQYDPYKNINSIWKIAAKDLPTLTVDKKKLAKVEGRNKDKASKRTEETANA
uniref:Uncharacterized protein n=1 Tax=Panagrolaimus sp. JU765 TaxID=591449 RepID=A0AC34PWF0_9BILA